MNDDRDRGSLAHQLASDGVPADARHAGGRRANGARIDRRGVLKALAALPLAATAVKLWAAPAASARPRVLVVFLRGGYDCANLLVPVSSSFYYESRPNIAIPKPDAGPGAAIQLDADWGLHPALAGSIHPLWTAGQVAFVPFAGIADTSRSHFATQDAIELGQPMDSQRDYQSGFMNRLASIVASGQQSTVAREQSSTVARDIAIAFTDQVPVTFRGSHRISNVALRNIAKPQVDARQTAAIAAMYRDTPYAAPVSDGFAMRDALQREMANEMESSGRNAITPLGFESEARRIARLMRERHALGFVDIGGWDTHVGQGGAAGFLATRFGALGRGLAAFANDMGGAWNDTTVVVLSEFGRTFRENGNRGTDHGHGSVYWVLGGSVRGGRIAGEQQKIDASTLFQDRDYPVLNEYRAVLGGLFARIYGLSAAQIDTVFARTRATDIGLA